MNKMVCKFSQFKAIDDGSMRFSCYTNVKGNVDHALDRVLDGAYTESIATHKMNGTMPKMFWNHQSFLPPVGAWVEMKEDSVGLYKEGYMLDTDRGIEIYKGMKAAPIAAIDSFSIGYSVVQEKWNSEKQCNDLMTLDIKESSPVNFACNEQARMVDIKAALHDGGLLTKADLRHLLQGSELGLSKREIERITAYYHPENGIKSEEISQIGDYLKGSSLFGN